jgi:serine/threonine protein kinase
MIPSRVPLMPVATTSDQFIELLHKSQLVDDERFKAAIEAAGGETPENPKALADLLIKQGVLTPFQASLLINGKWRGFLIANGKYKLLQLLGVGGMGKVYLCEHIRMKRLVALKVLPLDQLKDQDAVARFNREAVAAAALNHPNIVKAYDLDQDGSLHFLVLEYVDGSSLHEIVRKHGPLEISRACHYISQASLGLQHAHEAGWVHRDIKPGNLLLDRGGTVKLLDMGLARLFQTKPGDELTQRLDSKPVMGTADYLSPEQALNSSDVDIRTDIYSMGATLYYLLAGRAPYDRGTITEKLLAHQLKEPEPITNLRPDVPPALAAILKKMMAKKPVHRFQAPVAIAEALAPWTAGPIEPPADEEMPKRCLALETLASGTPSGPITGVHYRTNGNTTTRPGSAVLSSSHLLRKRMSPIKWLAEPKRRTPVVVGGGIAAGTIGVVLFLVIAKLFMGGSNDATQPPVARTNPPVVVAKPAPPTTPHEPAPNGSAISPVAAAKMVGEKVTIEFKVANTGATTTGTMVFLNSSTARDKDNFTVVLEMRKLEDAMKQAGIRDAKTYYDRKTLRVTGTVTQFKNSPQIIVDDLKQIEDIGK